MTAVLAYLHGPVPGTTPSYDVSVNGQVLSLLEQNFPDAPIPVFFVGKVDESLRDSLPSEFLDCRESSDDDSEDSSSKGVIEKPKEDCLLVWPKPVPVQGRNLLLMKMWNFDINEKNEDKREAVEVFHNLSFMRDVHGSLLRREGGGLYRTHFVVLCKGKKQEIEEYKSRPEGQNTNFVSIKDLQEPGGFFHHLLDVSNGPIPIDMKAWADYLHLATSFINIDSDKEFFVQHFPRFHMLHIEPFAHLLEDCKQKQDALRQALMCKFIVRGCPPSCKFDESFIATLQKLPTVQTVVLAVIGEPNIGKSTFLNYLIQRAFRRRTAHPFFAKGTTRDSSMLSCPLPLPGSSNKMLLIDVEGLSDAASLSEMDALMQSNLVSGVLVAASVPCFFVKNLDSYQQKQVERHIERYVFLSRNLNFSCDRIFVLSQDQDFRRGEQPDNEWVAKLNKRFFGGRPVVRLMSKPSFDSPSKADMRRDFLDTFLADCDFPQSISVAEIIAKIHSISKNSGTEQFLVDFASIDALKNKEVQYYKSKSELLLSIKSDPEYSTYSVELKGQVVKKLLANFRTCLKITPVLCIGSSQYGRSAILDSLLRRELEQFYDAEEVMGNFSNFASEGRPPGVYVWPNPIRVGDATLLLMKMWALNLRGFDDAFNDQVISALLCITSVCFVCSEKISLFDVLERVQKLYREVREALKLAVSQFVVFAENERQLASPESQESTRQLQECIGGPITTYLYRGDRGISESCRSELCDLLAGPRLHIPYLASHYSIQKNINVGTMMGNIISMLKILTRVVNLDLDYRRFVKVIPRFNEAEFEQQMNKLADFETYLKRMRGEALKFLIKDGDLFRFDTSLIQSLQVNYDLGKATIVLTIMGSPGTGKSTFLNRLIQMSTGSRRYREFF